jgi:mono/diheme cytochrome c family protein
VYAQYGCGACHGADGKGGFPNPNAETDGKVPAVIYVAEGFTRAELRRKILDGFPTIGKADPKGPRPPYRMPGWAGQMTDQDAGDLVEYLMSLYPKSEAQQWR